MISESLKKLIELQIVDGKLKEIEEIRGNLPQLVETLKSEIEETTVSLSEHNKRILEIDSEIRDIETDISAANGKLNKYKEQVYAVKTNKEYDALTQELDTIKTAISESENIVFELLEEKEEKEESIKNETAALEDLNNELEVKDKELEKRIKETEKSEKKLLKERKNIVPEISKPLLSKYDRVMKARKGIAVVPVSRNSCGGCFHSLPPQVVVEVRKMTKLIDCEYCGRLLVSDDTEL